MANAIEFKNVWEGYRLKFVVARRARWQNFWAVRNISFCVERGEAVGIIGENGAGKTTVLKLIAGLLKPDRGEISVNGRVCGLLDIMAGLQPELTGMENILFNAGMFGLTKEDIKVRLDDIVEFAGIGKFIYAPLKCYSQGMLVRLAFSTAVHADPDILLIDDTFSVADEDFQGRSLKKIYQLKDEGKTIVFVTHNMGLAASFARRGIFVREGRVLHDGLMQGAIAYYMETFGKQEGVGILEEGPLRVVFNNGRITLNYSGVSVTKGMGIYSTFRGISNAWESTQLRWRIIHKDESSLVAQGRSLLTSVTQTWRLKIEDANRLKFEVEFNSEKNNKDMNEHHIDFMLSDSYGHWKTAFHDGVFSRILAQDMQRFDVTKDSLEGQTVGLFSVSEENDLPKITIKNFEKRGMRARILNSDYQFLSRIISWQGLKIEPYYSFEIGFGSEHFAKVFELEQKESTIEGSGLKVMIQGKRLRIFYNGKEATVPGGVFSSINIEGGWLDAKDADWQIGRDSGGLFVKIDYLRIPITEEWRISIKGDSVAIAASLKVPSDMRLKFYRLVFILPAEYNRWFDSSGWGDCPDLFYGHGWVDCLQRSVCGDCLSLNSSLAGNEDAVVFNFDSGSLENFAKLYNASVPFKGRVVEIFKSFSEDGERLNDQGPSAQIKCLISFGKKALQVLSDRAPVELTCRDLRLRLNSGRISIWRNNIELTKHLGLYIAFLNKGRWHDSAGASWKTESADGCNLEATCDFEFLPLSALWKFRIEDNAIFCNVDLIVNKSFSVERQQLNLMLKEKYQEWICGSGKKGKFPQFSGGLDSDWSCVYAAQENEEKVGVMEADGGMSSLPQISLKGGLTGKSSTLCILNSDVYFRSRVLQCLNMAPENFSPGTYKFFSGSVDF